MDPVQTPHHIGRQVDGRLAPMLIDVVAQVFEQLLNDVRAGGSCLLPSIPTPAGRVKPANALMRTARRRGPRASTIAAGCLRGSWLASADAAAGRRHGGSQMTANRLLPAAIAALASAGAAHPQETDSHVAGMGSKGLGASHPFAGTKKRRATLRSGSEHWWGPTRPCDALSPVTGSLASRKR